MNKANETYDFLSPFPRRFSALMLAQNVTQKTIAEVCGVRRQSVSEWMNGNTRPDILSLIEIAKYFNVSTDYLLGLTDYKTNDKATRELCSTLGLSEEAVKILSADTSSVIAKRVANESSCMNLTDSSEIKVISLITNKYTECVRYVVNQLIEEFVSIHSNFEWGIPFEFSLLEYLQRFYEFVEAKDIEIVETVDGEFAAKSTGILGESVYLTGDTKNGTTMGEIVQPKALLIDAAIIDIMTKLNDIKRGEI